MAKREPKAEHSAPGLARLPPGRHGLPREFVVENQRGRLAAGMIGTVAEHGYGDATISQIAAAAGVSRRTFYGYFSSKEECFFDTYAQIARYLSEAMREVAVTGEWPEKVRARLAVLLEAFAANPDLVRFAMIAPTSAGGALASHYREQLGCLLEILVEDRPPTAREPSQAVKDGLAGGLAALIVAKVRADEGDRLAELAPDLLELVLAPYLGRDEAVALSRP